MSGFLSSGFLGSKSGSDGSVLSLPSSHVFNSEAERDAYFANNPLSLKEGAQAVVLTNPPSGLYQVYTAGAWENRTNAITGSKGDTPFTTVSVKMIAAGSPASASITNHNLEIEIPRSSKDPVIKQAVRFLGFFDTVDELKSAYQNANDGSQAIVLTQDQYYYEFKSGVWAQGRLVGDAHSGYIGKFTTLADLQAAHPTASADEIAIANKSWYVYEVNSWQPLNSDHAPAFDNKIQGIELQLNALQQARQSVDGALQVMRSDIAQKINGIHVEDIGNHAFDDINSLHFIGATVSDDGSQQATVTIDRQRFYVSNGQQIGSSSVTVQNLEFPGAGLSTRNNGDIAVITFPEQSSGVDVTVDSIDYTDQKALEFEQFTAVKQGDKLVLTPTASPGGGSNLILDDGTSSIGGITKIEVPTSKLVDKTGGVVELTPRVAFENLSGGYDTFNAHTLTVAPPLKVESSKNSPSGPPDPDRVTMTIDPAAYERQHTASHLAYLSDETNIVGKKGITKHAGALWFEDIVYSSPTYIQLDRSKKLVGIQEYDGLDPNVTGGQDYLIAFRVNMKGVAPEDGVVKVYLNEYDELERDAGILSNSNGQPMGVERSYKAGEKLGSLDVVGVVKATALRYFSCNVEDTFNDAYITLTDQTEGVTGLMVQALTVGEKSGPALLQFEADTNQDISFSSHYLGQERVDFAWLIRSNEAPVNIAGGIGLTMADGYGFYNLTPVKFGAENGRLQISDNGNDIADFNLHRILNAEETQMMRGRDVDVTVTLTNKDMGFRVALLKWDGKPDMYSNEIYKTRTNDSINLQPGWTIAGEMFISEDALSTDRIASKRFTVPADAINYAIMIYPTNAQQPMTLLLKDLRLDVSEPFTGYVVHYSEMDREKALAFSEQHMTLYQDSQGYRALRYTINGNDQPMPIGVLGNGLADVSIDSTINTIAGSMAKGGEGGLEFKTDGKATITTALRLWNEKNVSAAVMFWYELVEVGQQRGTMIDASKGVFTIHVGAQASLFYMPTFSIGVTAGQRLILRVTGDGPDCAFLQSVSPSAPMLYTTVTLDEFTTGAYDDPFSGIDMSQFTKTYQAGMTVTKDVANVASVVIPIDIPADVNVVVLGAIKQLADLTVRPVTKLDWSYSNKKKSLTVSFGETVLAGRVTMGFYL